MDNSGNGNNENEPEVKDYKAKDYKARIERLKVIAKDLIMHEKNHISISKALTGMTPEDAYIVGVLTSYMAKPLNPQGAMELAAKMSTQDAYFMGTSIGTFLHIMKADIMDML